MLLLPGREDAEGTRRVGLRVLDLAGSTQNLKEKFYQRLRDV